MGHLMFELIKTKKKMKKHIMLVVMPIKCNFWKPIDFTLSEASGPAEPPGNTHIATLLFPSLYSNSHDSSAPNSGVQCALLGWKEEVMR